MMRRDKLIELRMAVGNRVPQFMPPIPGFPGVDYRDETFEKYPAKKKKKTPEKLRIDIKDVSTGDL